MTVGELKKILNQYPENMEVILEDIKDERADCSYVGIYEPRIIYEGNRAKLVID